MERESLKYDAAIIGGGAAGLSAAVTYLKRKNHGKLLLIEAGETCGKKILATGNGRCNISNLSADDYYIVKEFFKSIGILFRVEDGGRVYPMSGQAASVRDALAGILKRGQAEVITGVRVSGVKKADDGYVLFLNDGRSFVSERLLIATGGKAGPQYGCYGDGYAFARDLGHSVESIRPALVPLVYTEAEETRLSGLTGVRIKSQAELLIDGKRTAASSGELQFTKYGLSGIMIFDLSMMMPKSIIEGKPRTEISIDLAPGEIAETLETLMLKNEGIWLEGVVGKKLSELLVREGNGKPDVIAGLAKNFTVCVSGTKGWKEAQATLGGVRVSEINDETGESLLNKGLFFAGETLEPVFICGGFNLNYAWITGIRAGTNL